MLSLLCRNADSYIESLRLVKSEAERDLMRKCGDLTSEMFIESMKFSVEHVGVMSITRFCICLLRLFCKLIFSDEVLILVCCCSIGVLCCSQMSTPSSPSLITNVE